MNEEIYFDNNERKKGLIAGVFFALVVGSALFFAKTGLQYANPFIILAWRFNFAFLSAFLIALISYKNKKQLLNFDKETLFIVFLYSTFLLLQTCGLMYSTSIEGAIIFAVVPIIATIISNIVLKEKANLKQHICMVVSVSALIYMIVSQSTEAHQVNLLGIFLLSISSVLVAISNVLMRKVRGKKKPFQLTFAIAFLGCIYINTVCGLATGFDNYVEPIFEFEFLISVFYLGAFSITCSSLLSAYSLSKLSALEASIFGNLSTIISIILGALILNEYFGLIQFVTSVVVILSVIGISVWGKK